MKLTDILTPQDVVSAQAREARLLAASGAARGGCRGTGSEARRYHVCLVALLGLALGFALGVGLGSGSLSEPSLTSDVAVGVYE